MKIRKAVKKDEMQILKLLNSDSFLTGDSNLSYNINHVKEAVEGQTIVSYVYEEDNEIKGVVMANIFRIGKYAEFYNIVVDKSYRNKGIGTKLANYMMDYLKKHNINLVFAYTEESNTLVHALAEDMGFKGGKKFLFISKKL